MSTSWATGTGVSRTPFPSLYECTEEEVLDYVSRYYVLVRCIIFISWTTQLHLSITLYPTPHVSIRTGTSNFSETARFSPLLSGFLPRIHTYTNFLYSKRFPDWYRVLISNPVTPCNFATAVQPLPPNTSRTDDEPSGISRTKSLGVSV